MRILIILLFVSISSCTLYDGYSDDFEDLHIGDSKHVALNIMGEPDNDHNIELPMISVRQLVWSPLLSDRTYVVFIFSDRVVAKTKF